MGIVARHQRQRLLRLGAFPLDDVDHRQIGVRLQVLRRGIDLPFVRHDRLVRTVEARQHVAAQVVDAVQVPDLEIVRAALGLLNRLQRRLELFFGALNLRQQEDRRRLPVTLGDGLPRARFRVGEAALLDVRAGEQLVRLARRLAHSELRMRDGIGRPARLEVREAEAEGEIGREDLRLPHRRFVCGDGIVVAAGLDENLAELRPDVRQPRIALQQRPQRGGGLVVAPLVGEVKGLLDLGDMADLVARIRQRTAARLRRPDVAERGELGCLLRIDVLQRRDGRRELRELRAHGRGGPAFRRDEIVRLGRVAR